MEQRQTGGKADECVFLNGVDVSSMLRRVRKESKGWQGGGSEPSLGSGLEGGQRGARSLW